MHVNMVGAFIRNFPFGTEIAFKKGLERLGHTVNAIDTSYPDQHWDHDATATVVFKWMEGDSNWYELSQCTGLKIVYQPDDARFPHITEMIVKMRDYCDLFLSFDQFGVDLAKKLRYRDAAILRLTADDQLYFADEEVEKDIDVSFVGSLTKGPNHISRLKMCQIANKIANERGWKTFFGEAYFKNPGHSPVDIFRRSKVTLNHATDVGQPFGRGYGLQCRHFEATLAGTMLLTNTMYGSESFPGVKNVPLYRQFDSENDFEEIIVECVETDIHKAFAHIGTHHMALYHLPQHRAVELIQFIERNL